MQKKYKPRTLDGASQMVGRLRKQLSEAHEILNRFGKDRIMLAKLAAKGPAFFNPLEVMAAEKIRDEILARAGMNPDGSFRK